MRSTAGCRCTPSAISSTSTGESSRAPTGPGSRWWSGRIALKRCVPRRAPASRAARDSSYVASVWPIAATTPASASWPHGLDPAGQLGREGDHAYGAVPRREEGLDRGRVRVGERARLVGAGALRAQPGALEVDAGEPTVLHQQGELADGVGHPLRGVGDQAGRHRRRPVGEVGVGDDRRRVRRTEVERRTPAAVHVEVDEPRDDGRPTEVDVGLARRRPLADLDDAVAVEEEPPRREDPRRGDHLSCSEDHVRPCCPARGSSHRRPGRPRPHDRAS